MGIYQELGITPIINAAGTYTVLGGSRMAEETLTAMNEAARDFIPIRDFQRVVHEAIATITKNEAAYVSNGAATGLYLAVAAAIELRRGRPFRYLSKKDVAESNIVMFKAHRNPYDKVIEHLGAQYRELSFPNLILPPTPQDLEEAIDGSTAAVYFAATGWVAPGYLPLKEVIGIAKAKGVPVVVDAAAQLPPVENLWKYSKMGVTATLFSGGKDLAGPQASGLMVGEKRFVDVVTSIGFPNYGIGRMMKVGREEMAGLYAAVKRYVHLDHQARYDWCEGEIAKLIRSLADHPALTVVRSYPNEAGQPIARAFVELKQDDRPADHLQQFLRDNEQPIYAYTENKHGVFINPMSLREGEMETIIARLRCYA